jgi:hypothetical protein
MKLQIGKAGLMIFDQEEAKSDIRDPLFKQGMKISTA